MFSIKDQLARPSKGRYFAVSVPEILTQLTEMEFCHPKNTRRINLVFRNPKTECEFGTPIAAFFPQEAPIVYSFSGDFAQTCATLLIIETLREFRVIDSAFVPDLSWISSQVVSYRAYLGKLNTVTITCRKRMAMRAKYRGEDKFSNACKPKSVRTEEKILHSVTINGSRLNA